MNPVFWLLLFIAVVITWFAISGLFIPIGRMLIKKWDRLVKEPEEAKKDRELKKWVGLVKDLEEPREEKEIKKVEENDNE